MNVHSTSDQARQRGWELTALMVDDTDLEVIYNIGARLLEHAKHATAHMFIYHIACDRPRLWAHEIAAMLVKSASETRWRESEEFAGHEAYISSSTQIEASNSISTSQAEKLENSVIYAGLWDQGEVQCPELGLIPQAVDVLCRDSAIGCKVDGGGPEDEFEGGVVLQGHAQAAPGSLLKLNDGQGLNLCISGDNLNQWVHIPSPSLSSWPLSYKYPSASECYHFSASSVSAAWYSTNKLTSPNAYS